MGMVQVQAYERQVDELVRSMKRGEEGSEDSVKERAALLHQLHAAEQVLLRSRLSPCNITLDCGASLRRGRPHFTMRLEGQCCLPPRFGARFEP